jgi:NAD(P)H-dependent FMN reductase
VSTPHVQIIVGSIRDGRVGEHVARWFAGHAAQRADLTSELVDLREWDLPFLTQPTPPMRGGYRDEITQRWAAKVGEADGYVLVTPEYNHGYPASLKNALDHVYAEWVRKPVSYVSYGGPGGGSRAVEQLRQVAVEFQQAPLRQQVMVHRFWEHMGEQGFAGAAYEAEATALLDELAWWSRALKTAREAGG